LVAHEPTPQAIADKWLAKTQRHVFESSPSSHSPKLILPQGHFEQILELGYGGRGAGNGVSHKGASEKKQPSTVPPHLSSGCSFASSPLVAHANRRALLPIGSSSFAGPTVLPHFPGIV